MELQRGPNAVGQIALCIVEVGLGIGDESRLREAEAAFTSVPDPKVGSSAASTLISWSSSYKIAGSGPLRSCGLGQIPRYGTKFCILQLAD